MLLWVELKWCWNQRGMLLSSDFADKTEGHFARNLWEGPKLYITLHHFKMKNKHA